MTTYPTRYLFIAETQGTAQASRQLNDLAAAMNRMNGTQAGGAARGGLGPSSNDLRGWSSLGDYVEKFGVRMRSALMYSAAFGVIGAATGAAAGGTKAWVDAQIQLNDVISDTIILLGKSRQEGEQFANVQRSLSFATGVSLAEVAPSSMMAKRVGQPELATSAAQWSLVVGDTLRASETVDDLRALSIQFDLSMEQINNSLLATMQSSGIVADQLFDLSASFGVFAGQLGLGESEKDLREISGLFAALSNITGQTTPTLQNFVRRMANEFYDPNALLRKQLEEAGITTVTQGKVTRTKDIFGNVTETAEEIRRPFDDIFAEIAAKGPAAIKAFSTAIDNSLGQPTQSQFILVAENWAQVEATILRVSKSGADFAGAVETAGEKTSTALDRVGIGFKNLLSAIGDGDALTSFLNSLASGLQNTYDSIRDTDIGFTRFSDTGGKWDSRLEEKMFKAYGDSPIAQPFERRLWEIERVLQVPRGLSGPQAEQYRTSAVTQFLDSRFFNPRDNGAEGAQSFQRFYQSDQFDMAAALKAAIGDAFSGEQIAVMFRDFLTETERTALGLQPLGDEAENVAAKLADTGGPLEMFMATISGGAEPVRDLREAFLGAAQRSSEVEAVMGPLAQGFSFAEGQVINLASAAGAAAAALGSIPAFTDQPQFKIPEGFTATDFAKAYDAASAAITEFEKASGLSYSSKPITAVALVDENGMPIQSQSYNPDTAKLAEGTLQQQKRANDKAAADQKSYYNKALAEQEAFQNKMLGAWNGMIGDILKPSEVTGTDLFYKGPTGTYNDNWDEPVRQMRADINNAIGGKPLEYNWGGLAPYMNMGAIEAARGSEQEVKDSILRSEEKSVAERFYNMELPWEAYSGNTDAIIANAQAWIAGKQQKNANMTNVQQLLVDAGLGPDAEAFVKAMEEPPILRQLFGGKSSEEISASVTEAITPNVSKAIGEQVASVSWSMMFSSAIETDATNNYEVIVAAGRAIGKPLAQGAASELAAAIVPLVIKAITGAQ